MVKSKFPEIVVNMLENITYISQNCVVNIVVNLMANCHDHLSEDVFFKLNLTF
jgi:hypothetical protein